MILHLENIYKSFLTGFANSKKTSVLKWLTCTINKWEIYGFLWINWAGKTTTLETIMWFHAPDQGQITFFWDKKLDNSIRQKIWYAPDNTPYFEYLTWRENIIKIANYINLNNKKIKKFWHYLFEELGLSYARDNYVQTYSQGMKQRLWLIISLINNPDLIIWDEPMNGLDPLWRIVVKNLMKTLKKEWKTIIFSTHILSDVEEIADKFGILSHGKMIYESSTENINKNLEEFFCDIVSPNQEAKETQIK